MNDLPPPPVFLISAKYVVDLGDREAFRSIAAHMARDARRRAGCSFLHAAEDVSDAGTFHLTEGWASEEAFLESAASAEFQAVLKEAMALRIRRRSGTKYFVKDEEALQMPT